MFKRGKRQSRWIVAGLLALASLGIRQAHAQSGSCEGVVTINEIRTIARSNGNYSYTIFVQNHQPRRIIVSFFTGNLPADVTLDMPVIQNLVMEANFAVGFRLGTGTNGNMNDYTVDKIYDGTSTKPYIRIQDCQPYGS